MSSPERQLEEKLIEKLRGLKYACRPDIRDRAALEKNFREKFNSLNHVTLIDAEFQRLLDEIVTPDVFAAAHTLRNRNTFTRDDGTPLNYTLGINPRRAIEQIVEYKNDPGKGYTRIVGLSSASA